MKKLLTFSFFAVLLLIFAASCSHTKNLAGDKGFSKKWNILSIDSVSTQKVADAKGNIDFSRLNAGTAKAGCNQMFFSYAIFKDGTLKLSGIGSTMMACPDMEAEDRLGKLLPLVNNYRLNEGVLELREGDKVLITAN